MEEMYTKREEDTYRKTVLDSLTRIETQTIKTNGRVNKLENWRSYMAGAIAIITILLLPILFLIISAYLQSVK